MRRTLARWVAQWGQLAQYGRMFLRDREYLRFLMVGGVNTLFGFVLYSLCILAGFSVWLALLLGNVAGIVFSFFTTGSYVFREFSPRRFPKFILCYLIVYFVNLGSIAFVSAWLSDKILVQAVLVLPMAALSYLILLKFVFSPAQIGS